MHARLTRKERRVLDRDEKVSQEGGRSIMELADGNHSIGGKGIAGLAVLVVVGILVVLVLLGQHLETLRMGACDCDHGAVVDAAPPACHSREQP